MFRIPPCPPRGLKPVCVKNNQTKSKIPNRVLTDPAAGIFTQIDDLALPGAGLRHLDFQAEVPSIFQGIFNSDGTQSHMQVPPISPSLINTESYVRTYGSEPEMYVREIQIRNPI